MSSAPLPTIAIWDVTYACPLRCTHCYSESGRRPSRMLSLEDALRLTDAIIAMRPKRVYISGGEPLLVKWLQQIAERFNAGGVSLGIYLGGFGVDEESAGWVARLFSEIHVSVDGADAATHDRIRGVEGSFEQAMNALSLFDRLAAQRRERGGGRLDFGISCSVVQSNFHQLEPLCSEVAPRFPRLRFLFMTVTIPSGLASREAYAELELLTDEQRARLRDSSLAARLRKLAPAGVYVKVIDNLGVPAQTGSIEVMKISENVMHIEADGLVRGISQQEGTVGSLLDEPPDVIWRRIQERKRDPFVVRELSAVRNMKDWAAASRNIDRHFGAPADLLRISRREVHTAETRRERPRE